MNFKSQYSYSYDHIEWHGDLCVWRWFQGQIMNAWVNSLWPSNAIRRQGSESTLAQVMVVVGRHQAITWTNVDLSPVRSTDILIRAISQQMPQPSITKICLKMTCLKFHSNFPGANELWQNVCVHNIPALELPVSSEKKYMHTWFISRLFWQYKVGQDDMLYSELIEASDIFVPIFPVRTVYQSLIRLGVSIKLFIWIYMGWPLFGD